MASLINMEMSKREAKEQTEPMTSDAPKYPWGLCVVINSEALEKLGIDALPAVDTEVTIVAKAQVSRISDSQTQGGESNRSMDLQITDMQIAGLTDDETASKLYDHTK